MEGQASKSQKESTAETKPAAESGGEKKNTPTNSGAQAKKAEGSPEKPAAATKTQESESKTAANTTQDKKVEGSPEKPAAATKTQESESKAAANTTQDKKPENSPEKTTEPTKAQESESKTAGNTTQDKKTEGSPEKPGAAPKAQETEHKSTGPVGLRKSNPTQQHGFRSAPSPNIPKKDKEGGDGAPEWLKKALERSALGGEWSEKVERDMAAKRSSFHPKGNQAPEWVEKAKSNRLSRDLSGIDKWAMKKPPALPQEPEWLSLLNKKREKVLEMDAQIEKRKSLRREDIKPDWGILKKAPVTTEEEQIKSTGVTVRVTAEEKKKLERKLEILKKKLERRRKAKTSTNDAFLQAEKEFATAKQDIAAVKTAVDNVENQLKEENADLNAIEGSVDEKIKKAQDSIKAAKAQLPRRRRKKKHGRPHSHTSPAAPNTENTAPSNNEQKSGLPQQKPAASTSAAPASAAENAAPAVAPATGTATPADNSKAS